MSLKEINDKYILGRENRNNLKKMSLMALPKINKKLDSVRGFNPNSINNSITKSNNLINSMQNPNVTSYNNRENFIYKNNMRNKVNFGLTRRKNLNPFSQSVFKTNND